MGGLHGLDDDGAELGGERFEVDLVANAGAEPLERLSGVVLAPEEAAVDDAWVRVRSGPKSAAVPSVEAATASPDPPVKVSRASCRSSTLPR